MFMTNACIIYISLSCSIIGIENGSELRAARFEIFYVNNEQMWAQYRLFGNQCVNLSFVNSFLQIVWIVSNNFLDKILKLYIQDTFINKF